MKRQFFSDAAASRGRTRRDVLKTMGALGLAAAAAPAFSPVRAMAQQSELLVGSGPVMAVSALEFAIARGYFANEGLTVKTTMAASGAATLAGVIGGSLQFAATNVTSTILARSRGIKIKIVAQESAGQSDPSNAFDGVLVRADSGLTGPLDLVGRTVAVNAINSLGTLTTSRAVEKAGGDYTTIKWVELPQGEALTALAGGQVDAIYIIEPFVTIGAQRGLKSIFSPYYETDPNFAESVVVASEAFLDNNPDTAAAFATAMKKATAEAASNPEAVRSILQGYMKIADELVPLVKLPAYPAGINRDSIQSQLDLALRYKYIDNPVSIDDLIWSKAN